MREEGFVGDCASYGALIGGYRGDGHLREALKQHDEMVNNGILPCVFRYSSIIDAFCKQTNVEAATVL